MRCHICDAALSDEEVKFNRDHKDFDPCGTCQEVIRNVFAAERDEGTFFDEGDQFGVEDLDEELIDNDG